MTVTVVTVGGRSYNFVAVRSTGNDLGYNVYNIIDAVGRRFFFPYRNIICIEEGP